MESAIYPWRAEVCNSCECFISNRQNPNLEVSVYSEFLQWVSARCNAFIDVYVFQYTGSCHIQNCPDPLFWGVIFI